MLQWIYHPNIKRYTAGDYTITYGLGARNCLVWYKTQTIAVSLKLSAAKQYALTHKRGKYVF